MGETAVQLIDGSGSFSDGVLWEETQTAWHGTALGRYQDIDYCMHRVWSAMN